MHQSEGRRQGHCVCHVSINLLPVKSDVCMQPALSNGSGRVGRRDVSKDAIKESKSVVLSILEECWWV